MGLNEFRAMADRRRYITPAQATKLLFHFFDRAKGHTLGSHSHYKKLNKAYLIYTLWRTGRRVSEIVGIDRQDNKIFNANRCPGLRPMDLDVEYKEIMFHILKKHPVRTRSPQGQKRKDEVIQRSYFRKQAYTETIAYDSHFFDKLNEYVKWAQVRPHERIFPYNRIYVEQFIKQAADACDINLGYRQIKDKVTGKVTLEKKKISPHCFRHGFAMNLLKQNQTNPLALPMLQEILCHCSINVTKSYLRFDQKDRLALLNKTFGEVK